ncbi:hypothetical protein PPROV_000597700 [Pycnococcus provasolii]|uniref:Receptor L-domain domain-containing protein n=1 Tax=Pycnococcus provasolii TaxID=41880 RepID=A0A830HIQ5_9CHLO|nr:hypothetical protein PPROV_000597700 [Pycnococcus provasolii]
MYSPLNDTYTTHTSLNTQITGHLVLTTVDLSALTEAGDIRIVTNPELVDVKLPELTVASFVNMIDNKLLEQLSLPKLRTTNSLDIRDNENLVGIFLPVLTTSRLFFRVIDNPSLQTLCAPNLEVGGSVCIANESNQPSLGADLSSLVTGFFSGFSDDCYGGIDPPTNQLNAPTVCGVVPDGLFTTEGCQN